jgi:hypothetical protein
MTKISSEDIRKEVHRFWAILSGNLADKLEEMYSPTAIVFTGKAKRSESAKLVTSPPRKRDGFSNHACDYLRCVTV